MEKEEVLAMSRKEKNDEGLVAVENRGRRLGIVAISIVLLVMMVINFIAEESNFGFLALYLSFLANDVVTIRNVITASVVQSENC